MPRQDRVKALLAAVNGTGTYGADAAPTAAMRAYGFRLGLDSRVIEDDAVQPYMGAGDDYAVGRNVSLQFGIRAVGSGTAGDPPPFGVLLRMCGLSETLNAGTDVTYEPVSSGFEDGTIYFMKDGKRRALTGARGTVTLSIERENVPALQFEMRGLYAAPTEAAMPAVDWSAWPRALPAEPTNTPTFSVHGHSPRLLSLSAQLGQDVAFVPRVNDERIDITNRKATGNLVVDEPDTLATHDYEAAWVSGATGALSVVHGTAAGNIVEFAAPKVRITSLNEGESEGRVTQEMGITLMPPTGDDEWRLIIR